MEGNGEDQRGPTAALVGLLLQFSYRATTTKRAFINFFHQNNAQVLANQMQADLKIEGVVPDHPNKERWLESKSPRLFVLQCQGELGSPWARVP